MASERNDSEELEQLREILLGPFEEHLKLRDEKILEVIGKIQTSTFERVKKLEETVLKLSEALDEDRNRTVTEIGDAMAQLGQQLRGFGLEQVAEPAPEKEKLPPKQPAAEELPPKQAAAEELPQEEPAEDEPPAEKAEAQESVEKAANVEEADVFEKEAEAKAAS
ncbi:MAG: hypothetical protein ACR2OR_17475 [Hyphomicrobiales bacterium]